MSHIIRFAGLTMNWQYDYAKKYADKLHEMGYCAKVIQQHDCCLVAYAHRPFSIHHAQDAYDKLMQKGEGKQLGGQEARGKE